MRSRLSLHVACFSIGSAFHARDFYLDGLRPYRWAPLPLEVFWSSLVALDALTVVLLLALRLRAGLALATIIMVADVLANAYALFYLRDARFASSLPLQAMFLAYVLATLPFLWPVKTTTSA